MALSSRSFHKLRHRTRSSPRRYSNVVYRGPHVRRLERIRLPFVDTRKTYDHLPVPPSLLLMSLLSPSGLREECSQVRPHGPHPILSRGTHIFGSRPALRSSRISILFPTLGRRISLISFSTLRIPESKTRVLYSRLSLSSSPISPILT